MTHAARDAERRLPKHVILLLLGLLLVRVLAATFIAPEVVSDAAGYVESARRLIETGTFAYPPYSEQYWTTTDQGDLVFSDAERASFQSSRPNALTMPGYAAFLAAVWFSSGLQDDPAVAARIAQALLSVLTAALVYLIGCRASERVGLLALVLYALYPPFTLANSYLNIEVLYGFLLVLGVYLFLRWNDHPTYTRAIVAGAIFGAGFLVRPTALPWLALAVAFAVLANRKSWRSRAFPALLLLGTSVVLLAPWASRNLVIYNELVPFGTSAAVNTVQALWHDHGEPFGPAWSPEVAAEGIGNPEIAEMTQRILEDGQLRAHDDRLLLEYYEPASRELTRAVFKEDAIEVLLARLRSVGATLTRPHAVAQSVMGGIPYTISWIAHCLMLVFAAMGATRLGSRQDMWIIASVPVYFVAVHAVIFPLWRHYFPTLGLVCVLAAIGLLFCVDALRGRLANPQPTAKS